MDKMEVQSEMSRTSQTISVRPGSVIEQTAPSMYGSTGIAAATPASVYAGGSVIYPAPSVYGGGSVYGDGSVYGGVTLMPMAPSYPATASNYAGSAYGASTVPTNRISWMSQSQAMGSHNSIIPVSNQSVTNYPMSPPSAISMGYAATGQPSNEELLAQIRLILSTADLMTVTRKSVREDLGKIFKVDLSGRKDYIHMCIDGILKGEL